MTLVVSVTTVLLPLLYLVSWGLYLWIFRSDNITPRRIASRFTAVVLLIHIASLVAKARLYDRLPLGSGLEFASGLAVALMATYLFIERRRRVKQTGFLVAGLAFFLQFIASAFSTSVPEASPLLHDPGFAGHVVLVLLAYTALTVSFLYAVLYLVLARQLGRRQFGLLFRRLPSLDVLERMSVGAVELGVPLLFLSLALGHLWMYSLADRVDPELAARLSPWDPKILISWVILLGYSAGLAGYRFLGWRGRRMNMLAVTAYVVVIVTMGLVQHFVPSFHDFRQRQEKANVSLMWPIAVTQACTCSEHAGGGR
jgi:HemX protein